MIVRYNSLNRFETPKFTLCQPGSTYSDGLLSKTIGALVDHEAEEIVFNFNASSELNLRVNKIVREDAEENAYVHNIYKSIQNRRLIYAEDIGYFVITNVVDGYDNNINYKDITAKSVDAELQQKMIPYIADGTYRFSTDITVDAKGIFEMIVETLPLWTIGHIDGSVAKKWRTFQDVDTSMNCHAFLIDKVQDAYECIVVFDIINRVINVYSKDNYVRQTDIHITKDDLINSIDITENADDIYTAIRATGEDNVSISAVNPLGTNVIYNFNYYLSWMPDILRDKVIAWQSAVDDAFDEHYALSESYYQKLKIVANLQHDMDKINTQITMYKRCRDNIVAQSSTDIVEQYNPTIAENGGNPIIIEQEISATLDGIDRLIETCYQEFEYSRLKQNAANADAAELKASIDDIHSRLGILKYFDEDEYAELCLYIYEGNYNDEYVIVTDSMSYEERFEQMKILYDRAKSSLDKVSEPTREFNIDVESFIFMKEFAEWSEQLETGCLINVELDVNDVAAIFLSSITLNYDDHSMKLTFGNRYNKFDPKSLFDNVLGNIAKSANTLNYIKDAIYPIKNGEFSAIREVLQTSRDLTMSAALAATNEEVVIDGSGYTGRKLLSSGAYDDKQIKIVSNSIVFTDDGWDSCSLALGDIILDDDTRIYGINAKAVFGDMIIGGGLKIYDNNGEELLSVVDGIKTNISSAQGDITSLIATANGITSRVENAEGEISEVKQTAGDLQSTVSKIDSDLYNDQGIVNQISTITQTASDISLTVQSVQQTAERAADDAYYALSDATDALDLAERNLSSISTLQQTAQSITAKVAAVEENERGTSERVAALEITAEGINAKVSSVEDLANHNEARTLKIEGDVNGLTTTVSKKVDGDKIISTINQSAEAVTIDAEKINLHGVVTANNYFKINTNGSMQATGGTIGGWTIDSNSLYSGSWSDAADRVFMCTGTNGSYTIGGYTGSGWVFGAGDKFGVTKDGAVYATSGTIGGWTMGGTQLSNTYTNSDGVQRHTFMQCTSNDANAAFGVYNRTSESEPWTQSFYVTNTGYLQALNANIEGRITSTSGSIGGWTIGTDSITSSNAPSGHSNFVGLYSGPQTTSKTIGNVTSDNWRFVVGSSFGVTGGGALSAKNANISGTIYASGGTLGGWNFDSTKMWDDSKSVYFWPTYLQAYGTNFSTPVTWLNVAQCVTNWSYTSSNESDQNVKNSISNIDDYDSMFDNLKPCKYKYNHGTSDRYHTGFIAQEVVEAIENAGLTTQDFAGVIHLEKPNENGSEWLLRRDEFVALNTWQIQKLKSRVVELETQIESLKALIASE